MDAMIISSDTAHPGIIENISEHGLCLETDAHDLLGTSNPFAPGTDWEVQFRIPSGKDMKLRCKVTWSYKAAPHGVKRKIGMEVIFPPPVYVDFYRNPSTR